MTNVTKITASTGATVVAGAMEKLAEYAATLGLAVSKEGRWVYDQDGSYLQMKIKFTVGGEDGLADQQAEEFGRWARYYGLEPSDYGVILTIRGSRYKLVKINTRRGVKYPFECERVDGGTGIRLPDVYKHEIIAARKA